MDDSRKYLKPEVLAELKGLDLKARLIVEGYVSGLHKSPFHGFSVEFAEHREYVPGDDPRYIDWKLYGKRDRFYLKQFEEETNFSCHILLDCSESMLYQSAKAPLSKFDYARHVAAALSYLILHQQDAVGLAMFHKEVEAFTRASSQPSHLNQLIAQMEQTVPREESSMGPLFHTLAERIKKRGLVVIISDFFDDLDLLRAGLKHFRYRKHDVSLLQIIDPAEEEFPFDEPTLFKGLEGFPEELADPRALKKGYQQEFEHFQRELKALAREMKMEYQMLRTDHSLAVALSTYLATRMHRTNRM